MLILAYIHHLSMYNNDENYGLPAANKERTSEAEGLRMQEKRTGTGTVDIHNKGKNRTGTVDIDNKEITVDQLCTGAGQIMGVINTRQGDNGTQRPEKEEGRQHQSTTQLQSLMAANTVSTQQPLHQQTTNREQNNTTRILKNPVN